MAENGERRIQKILEGIQYLIGDNKHLREELRDCAMRAEEDRRRADEDRRRSDQRFERMMEGFDRTMERAEEDRARSDERFSILLDQVRRSNRVAVELARDIRGKQDQTNRLLEAILKRLPPSNGK